MTSTVLDGVLCLLLISAAVVTVTAATPNDPVGEGRAPNVAEALSTTTASVNYTLVAPDGSPADSAPATTLDRTAHGTLTELLARAAVARIAVDDRRLSHTRDGLGRAVVRTVGAAIRANHTQVTAVWRPHPGSSITGRIAVGAPPPPGVPVHAATVTGPSGFPAARTAADSRATPAVANAAATGVVEGLFPPTRTRIAAGRESPTATLVRQRYRRTSRLFGVSRRSNLSGGEVEAANDRLASAMADRIARDASRSNASMRRTAVRIDQVRITVRTWP
ncbi:DUF7284 family protein [Haloplanus halobius]|uniref:DUF7284 family protein n=1 Tax=Haloplanus halobius TaxID=2934938 RepID=UPI00200E5E81|nr:hypothetical protein [Haloplanus sp. XH21]